MSLQYQSKQVEEATCTPGIYKIFQLSFRSSDIDFLPSGSIECFNLRFIEPKQAYNIRALNIMVVDLEKRNPSWLICVQGMQCHSSVQLDSDVAYSVNLAR
ncbi:unnamed protein product [Ilex paraguariensis]|uniref:Uncharacterized protein n=1 Tax=Ilex paraguariensis TaxID=185542 RepID=A0ABC8SF40_9AQUA